MELDRDALLRTFQQEAEDLLAELERLALDLDEKPENLSLVQEMFRCVHTLKGGASCVGLESLVALAHELEGLLEAITSNKRNPNRALSSLTLEAVDVMRSAARVPAERGLDPIPGDQQLLADIQAWLEDSEENVLERSARAANRAAVANAPRALRVDVERLDNLLNLVGEVAVAQGRLQKATGLGRTEEEASAWQTFEGLFQSLQESVLRLRLVPIGPTLERFRRAVRDLSHGAEKQAELVTEGGDVEVDISLAEALGDPLMHMVRNAVDHGIESAERRRALGKDPVGRITLKARHDGHYVVIEVVDDGAGIDTARLLARARSLGIDAAEDDLDKVNELAFTAGLSTAEAVTSLSGRGIGMDVVRRDIEAMRGSVTLDNQPGKGLTASIRVPLTVAMIQGFGVRVGSETYILPVDSIRECIDLDRERAIRSDVGGVLELRGKPLPFVDLAEKFGATRDSDARRAIVVLEHGTQRAGLEVDALLGEVQTVIKPLGTLFASVDLVAGSAVLGDGRVALVLDVGRLLRSVA